MDRYITFLEGVLTPSRLEHSFGVMQVMGELAGIYNLDRDRALLAGLLHDAEKDLAPEQQVEILKESSIEIHFPCDRDYVLYLHGPVGSYYVQKELGITDTLILDAISMHTFYGSGENFDAPLNWCLRFADLLEPNRNWNNIRWLREGLARFRKIVYAGGMAEGAFLETGWLIKWFEEGGKPVHPNMKKVYQRLSAQLELDDTYLE